MGGAFSIHFCHVRVGGFRTVRDRLVALLSACTAAPRELRQHRFRLFAVHLLPVVAAARLVRRVCHKGSVARAPLVVLVFVVEMAHANLAAQTTKGGACQTAAPATAALGFAPRPPLLVGLQVRRVGGALFVLGGVVGVAHNALKQLASHHRQAHHLARPSGEHS